MNAQDLIGKTVRIVGIDTGGGAGQSDFVSHIAFDIDEGDWRGRVFIQTTDPAHTWEVKAERRYDLDEPDLPDEAAEQRDPLHDALVAIFYAIAQREEKPVAQVVEELFSGYVEGAIS